MRFMRSPAFSPVGLVGWALILGGGAWDLLYHIVPLFSNVRWSPVIDVLGEFGHTVVLVGMVIVVLAVRLSQHRKRMR